MSFESDDTSQLDDRSRSVLRLLVREHVRTGKPVGSRRLSRLYSEGLSPATLRNVMADLDDVGLVAQPHPSAGRVPTREGYRFFVQSLLKTRSLSERELNGIRKSLEEEADLDELMSRVSQLLAEYSNSVGIVLSPPISRVTMKHLEFVKLSRERLLVILVTATGLVHHRLIRIEESLTQSELDQAGKYLVQHFSGKSLVEIRVRLVALLSEDRVRYDRMLRNVALLGSRSLAASEEGEEAEAQVYLGGATKVMDRASNEEVAEFFQAIEEKRRLIRIISQCICNENAAPNVTIGLEHHFPNMYNWTLITSPYSFDPHSKGGLGILGPSRMEYERAISLVEYVAKIFGQILRHN